MNICVIGLGSMGKRRIRLLKNHFEGNNIWGVDQDIKRCEEVEKLFKIKTSVDLDDIINKENIDAVFISTPPLNHATIINKVLNFDINVFTEINLVNDYYDENISLAKDKGLVLFLSSTQLYRREINFINNKVKDSDELSSYIYHIGNYLPDWHPWENYNDFFIGKKKTNGIREILAIELPWIINTFGNVKYIHVSKSKFTKLKIDFPDTFLITIEHISGYKGVLIIDLVSRVPVRNLEIIGENKYISWDGKPSGLKDFDIDSNNFSNINLYETVDYREDYNETVIEDAYLEEIKDFFDCMKSKKEGIHSFDKDKYILNIIDIMEDLNDNESYEF